MDRERERRRGRGRGREREGGREKERKGGMEGKREVFPDTSSQVKGKGVMETYWVLAATTTTPSPPGSSAKSIPVVADDKVDVTSQSFVQPGCEDGQRCSGFTQSNLQQLWVGRQERAPKVHAKEVTDGRTQRAPAPSALLVPRTSLPLPPVLATDLGEGSCKTQLRCFAPTLLSRQGSPQCATKPAQRQQGHRIVEADDLQCQLDQGTWWSPQEHAAIAPLSLAAPAKMEPDQDAGAAASRSGSALVLGTSLGAANGAASSRMSGSSLLQSQAAPAITFHSVGPPVPAGPRSPSCERLASDLK